MNTKGERIVALKSCRIYVFDDETLLCSLLMLKQTVKCRTLSRKLRKNFTLTDGATLEDRRDFAAELDTMIRIGKHKNVVSLIGACEHDNTMFLCTEFAPLGNLLQYLRRSRRIDGGGGGGGGVGGGGCTEAAGAGTYTTLTQAQILQFAYEVAQGMTYLSEKQVKFFFRLT